MPDAFTAGVKPGGLTDKIQIRILLCYLIKTAGPLSRSTLEGALLQEELANYFEIGDALAELKKQNLIATDEEELYITTPRGDTVADTLAFDLPRTVRESAIRAVGLIQSWRYQEATNRASIEERDGEFAVCCAIGDFGSDVFRLELVMPDRHSAEMVKNHFIAHGSEIYTFLIDQLTMPSTDGERPPEGLM